MKTGLSYVPATVQLHFLFFDNVHVLEDRVFYIEVKTIWHIDVLRVAKANVREINEHHLKFILVNGLRVLQVEYLKYVFVQFIVATPTENSCQRERLQVNELRMMAYLLNDSMNSSKEM